MEDHNINYWIYLFFVQDPEALVFLHRAFEPMIQRLAQTRYTYAASVDFNYDDLRSLSLHTLYQSLYRFQIGNRKMFTTFFRQVLYNTVTTWLRDHSTYRYVVDGTHLFTVAEKAGIGYACHNQGKDVHQYVLNKVSDEHLLRMLKEQLTEKQWTIFQMRQQGYRRCDILETLHISRQVYDYSMRKVKKILASID